jgi:hypothetical protein
MEWSGEGAHSTPLHPLRALVGNHFWQHDWVIQPVNIALGICHIETDSAEFAPGVVWVRSNAMDSNDAEPMSEFPVWYWHQEKIRVGLYSTVWSLSGATSLGSYSTLKPVSSSVTR